MPNLIERAANQVIEQVRGAWSELKEDGGMVEAVGEILRTGGLIILIPPPKGKMRLFRHAPYREPSDRVERVLEVFTTGGLSLLMRRRPTTNQDKK